MGTSAHSAPSAESPQRGADWVLAILMMSGVYVAVEPAPFDVGIALVAVYLLITRRLRMPPSILLPIGLLVLFGLANIISLLMLPDPGHAYGFIAITFYLMALWFVIVGALGPRGVTTLNAMLWGYSILAGISGAAGAAAYLGFPGLSEVMAPGGRLFGFFKDPNVFGAYLVPAALYAIAQLIGRQTRRRGLWIAVVLACLPAVFLTFSRGAWGNFAIAAFVFLVLFTFADGLSRAWWRTMVVVPVLIVIVAVIAYQMLSITAVSDMFDLRFGMQSYDSLRFSNQRDAFETALNHPLGLGPGATEQRFRVAAHSVYVWALVENGLLGLVSLVALMVSSAARALWLAVSCQSLSHRLLFAVVASVLCAMYAEAAIIDVIHWRHFWLFLAFAWCPAPALKRTRVTRATVMRRGR